MVNSSLEGNYKELRKTTYLLSNLRFRQTGTETSAKLKVEIGLSGFLAPLAGTLMGKTKT